jgi:hypothetical protein
MDQLLAEIFGATLADAEQLRFAAGGELLRHDAEPRRKITPSLKALRSPDGATSAEATIAPNPGIVVSRRASSFPFAQRTNSASKAAVRRSSSARARRRPEGLASSVALPLLRSPRHRDHRSSAPSRRAEQIRATSAGVMIVSHEQPAEMMSAATGLHPDNARRELLCRTVKVSRLTLRRMTTAPDASRPTTLQMFLPRSTPSIAVAIPVPPHQPPAIL